jgi:hypothetical protein
MDRTTRDESDDETSNQSNDLEPRLSSDDTLEAEIEFVSSEDDLAAPSTEEESEEEHEEQVSRDDDISLIVDEAQTHVLVPGENTVQETTDTIAEEAQQDMVTTGTGTAPAVTTGTGTGTGTVPLRWLGTGRTTVAAEGMVVALKKEDRSSLTADYLLKLQKKTTEGMELTFSLMTHGITDQLEECYNLGLRVETLKNRLRKTDLIGGFDIWCSAGTVITPADVLSGVNGPTLCLIDNIDEILEDYVRKTMRFKRYYGQEYDLQDLQWSQELLENSCDEELRNKIREQLKEIPADEQGGALYYYLMIELIQVDTDNAVRSLTTKLANLDIGALEGENVMRACSLIRGVHDRLKLVGKVPHDVIDKLMRVFQTTSVDKFNQLFLTLSYNKDLGLVDAKLLTVSKLIKLAETKYQDLMVAGEWTRCGSSGPAFAAIDYKKKSLQPRPSRSRPQRPHVHLIEADRAVAVADPHEGKTCWSCGGKNHISSNCPIPRTRRPGRGRGREGRGSQGGRGPGRGGDPTPDPNPSSPPPHWRTQAPRTHESHAKVVGHENVFWCGRCGLWNSHHPTLEHLVAPCPASLHTALRNSAGGSAGGGSLVSSERGYPIASFEYERERGDREDYSSSRPSTEASVRPYVSFADKVANTLNLGNRGEN